MELLRKGLPTQNRPNGFATGSVPYDGNSRGEIQADDTRSAMGGAVDL